MKSDDVFAFSFVVFLVICFVLMGVAIVRSCNQQDEREGTVTELNINGIKVYRFYDKGYPVYIATKDGNPLPTNSEFRVSHGKTSETKIRNVIVPEGVEE